MHDDQPLTRWRAEVRRTVPHADAEFVEELAQHLSQRWLSAKAEGLADEAADDRVRRDLDDWRRTPVPRRRPASASLAIGLAGDIRYSLRALRVKPTFTVAAVLLTTIATATTVAAFTVTYGILWRPLRYPESHRLAVLWQVHGDAQGQIAYPDYADVSQASVFDGGSAISTGRVSLRLGEDTERVQQIWLEPRGYELLGATPHLGRLLNAGDAGRRVVLISHRLWSSKLGADPGVVGKDLWISGAMHSVAGVLPQGFDFELPISSAFKLRQHDVWGMFDASGPRVDDRRVSTYEAIVRLAPGATFAQAQAAADAVGQRLAETYPDTNVKRTFRVRPLRGEMVRLVRTPLLLVCGAALAALAIALANLIALTLVRLADRQPEIAVRAALGAGGLRLRRQLFIEHLAIAVAGGFAGVMIAARGVRTAIGSAAADLPRVDAIAFDAPVFAAALAVIAVIAITLTLLPLRTAASAVALRAAGRGTTSNRRARQILVAGELALALALSAGGALVGLSLVKLFSVDLGFTPAGVAAVRVSAYDTRYPRLEHITAFVQSILDRLAATPGIAHAAAGSSLPLSGQMTGTTIQVEGTNLPVGSRPQAAWQFVTPGYFAALGMPLLRGRDFTTADRDHAGHVTILNDTLARELFGDADPIGRRISTGEPDDWHVVIGVVGSVRHIALDVNPEPRMYDLFGEHWGRTLFVVAQSATPEDAALIPDIRRAIRVLDREAPVFESAPMTALVARSAAAYRLAASLAGGMALASILLALIGVYAVMAASVSGRTREIGVRAALGASPGTLQRLILGEGAIVAGVGCAIGLAGAGAVARLLQAQLFGVRLGDIALILPAVSTAILLAALAAALPAARRAARVDPLIAMRAE